MMLLALLLLGYLAGSVQSAVLVSRWAGKVDPRTAHSANPGATNVYRTAGPGWAALVLGLDVARAAVVGWLAHAALSPPWVPGVGVAALVGTFFPIFHGFKGGKGVATWLGFGLGAMGPVPVGFALAAWVTGRLITGKSYLGSLPMVIVLSVALALASGGFWGVAGSIVGGLCVISRHRPNFVSARAPRARRPPDDDP